MLMKRIFTFIFMSAFALAGITINAEVLLQESFQIATDGALATETYDANSANLTNWYKNGSKEFAIAEGSLNYDNYSQGAGNMLQWGGSTGKAMKRFAEKKMSSIGSIYAAALIKPTSDLTTTKNYFLALSKTEAMQTAGNHVARVHIYNDGEGFRLGIAKCTDGSNYLRYTPTLYSFDKTYLIVAEYKYVDGDKNDEVLLYVNPVKGNKPAATVTCVQDTLTGAEVQQGAKKSEDAVNMCGIVLNGTATIKNMLIDEIKVCTEWNNLWTASSDDKIPTIEVSAAQHNLGILGQGEQKQVKFTVTGKDLSKKIELTSAHSEVSISPAEISAAAAVSGVEVTVTINPNTPGAQNAAIEISSEGATSQSVNIAWNTILAANNIAELREKAQLDQIVRLLGNSVVVYKFNDFEYEYACVQDESGAIILSNGAGFELSSLQIGDQIGNLDVLLRSNDDATQQVKVNGLTAVMIFNAPQVIAQNVEPEPFAVSIQDIKTYTDKYGAALVKLTGVEFVEQGTFTSANYTIKQNSQETSISISSGCDIIGEDIPKKADLVGVVRSSAGMIQLRKSADLTNRINDVDTALDQLTIDSDNIEIYTILGNRISKDNLQSGAYIIKSGKETKKIIIK